MRLFILLLSLAAVATVALSGQYDIGGSMVADTFTIEEETIMESEIARRQLGDAGYISYAALSRNNVPCDYRGLSYYNCRDHQVMNPYTRGCTKASKCARAIR